MLRNGVLVYVTCCHGSCVEKGLIFATVVMTFIIYNIEPHALCTFELIPFFFPDFLDKLQRVTCISCINPIDFAVHLAFLIAPPSGWLLLSCVKC